MRNLANLVGNEVMKSMVRWPSTGEGRAVKALTEAITRRLDGQQPTRDLDRAFDTLLRSATDFDAILDNSYFRASLAQTPLKKANSRDIDTMAEVITNAIDDTRSYIQTYVDALPPVPTPREIAASEVANLAPEQKTGPLRFALSDGVIRVEHQPAVPASRDLQNINAARRELIAAGAAAADFLHSSNFDPRLAEELYSIVERLDGAQDVIALGIAAIAFQQVVDIYKDELPNYWSAKLQGFSLNLSMYVAQFPEWKLYAENAADAEYSAEDVSRLYVAGHTLTEQLKTKHELVDPEVPRSLAFLLEAIRDPRRAAKRTVFAAIRSIENLVSVIFKAFGTVLSGVPEGAKKGVIAITASGLLLAAAHAAVTIDPAAGRVLRTSWLGKAGKLIMENLKDD